MKAIQYSAARNFSVTEVEKPVAGPNQVVIRVKACGICKTDLSIHNGDFIAKFPLINGHEFAGVIDSVGSAVTEWKPGDRVTADNTELCGYCEACRNDKPLYCENFNSHGCNMSGGFAEYVLINHDKVFAISDHLTFEQATFTEPTACAVHGVDRIAPRFGDSILMFGAGPTGIILAQLLRRAGAGRMVIADPHAEKLDVLRKYGFTDLVQMNRDDPSQHTAVIKQMQPKGFDIVIDATGAASVFAGCFDFVHMGSKIVSYGVCAADAKVPVSPYEIFSQEYTILGSFAQTHCFGRALEYLERGDVQVEALISHRLPLSDYGKGLDLIMDKKAKKVIILP
ncbi:MAG: zinc-dependent alcohol dehydrogenase family protein [Pseudoflavonifractor sp.]